MTKVTSYRLRPGDKEATRDHRLVLSLSRSPSSCHTYNYLPPSSHHLRPLRSPTSLASQQHHPNSKAATFQSRRPVTSFQLKTTPVSDHVPRHSVLLPLRLSFPHKNTARYHFPRSNNIVAFSTPQADVLAPHTQEQDHNPRSIPLPVESI